MSNKIPLDICSEILVRLPAQSLFRFRAVCKQWRTVIDDPCFVKSYTNNQLTSYNSTNILIRNSAGHPFNPLYYIDLEALNFTRGLQTITATPLDFTPNGLSRLPSLPVAECNGLMLIAPLTEGTWEIWNPLTQERLILPQPTNIINSQVLGYGLGYDCIADDYKVVLIDYFNHKSLRQTHVYNLRSDSWRTTGNLPFYYNIRAVKNKGVFLNGSLHWVLDDGSGIIVFNLRTESYHQLALPDFKTRPKSVILNALSGCLFFTFCFYEAFSAWYDFWVMNDYGAKDSWTRLFRLSRTYDNLRPVAYMKNKMRVLLQNHQGFVLFDAESKTCNTLDIHGISENISAQACVGSLVRLHDSCGRVAASKKRTRKMKMADTITKLTFCVQDIDKYERHSHDSCYSFSSNWYIKPSNLGGDKVVLAPSLNPGNDSIPLDICREIFMCLPSKSLIRFRAICKAWRAVIDESRFVRAHTEKQHSSNNNIIVRNSTGPPFHPFYSFDLNDLNFADGLQKIAATPLDFTPTGLSLVQDLPVPACNGLILLVSDHNNNNHLEIWNPFTHERLELPQLKFKNSNSKRVTVGIGYDYTTDDYKAVAIHREEERKRKFYYQTHVYSLKLDSWRKTRNFPCCDRDWKEDTCGPCVFLCGSLHWTLSDSSQGFYKIIALDLGTESYRQLQPPPICSRGHENWWDMYLDVLDGCLILSVCFYDGKDDTKYYDVWVMKDYGVGDSWTKLFSKDSRPLSYLKNKKQLFTKDDEVYGFCLLDFESHSDKDVHIHGLTRNLSAQIVPRSIFRLHDNCGVSGKTGRRREVEIPEDTELYFCVSERWLHRRGHDLCCVPDYLSTEDDDMKHCTLIK